MAGLKNQVEFWEKLEKDIVELGELAAMTSPDLAPSQGGELEAMYEDIKKKYEQTRVSTFFSDKYDDHSVIVSIHSGAGGLDAQDWAEILLRKYLRFGAKPRF